MAPYHYKDFLKDVNGGKYALIEKKDLPPLEIGVDGSGDYVFVGMNRSGDKAVRQGYIRLVDVVETVKDASGKNVQIHYLEWRTHDTKPLVKGLSRVLLGAATAYLAFGGISFLGNGSMKTSLAMFLKEAKKKALEKIGIKVDELEELVGKNMKNWPKLLASLVGKYGKGTLKELAKLVEKHMADGKIDAKEAKELLAILGAHPKMAELIEKGDKLKDLLDRVDGLTEI